MSPAVYAYSLLARDTADDLASVPDTFSSWDKCMNKSYCKWPVIVGIIVGGVILISVIACIVNCLCCGIRCCTCCCSCCCPSPRPKKAKYADDPYHQIPPPMPPMPSRPPINNSYETGFQPGYQTPQAPPTYRGAQVARFDAPPSPGLQKMNEDALPAMPSWDHAVTRRVEDNSPQPEAVEMEPLNPLSRPPHRAPSAPRSPSVVSRGNAGFMGPPPPRSPSVVSRGNANGFMGPPPIRTAVQNDYYPDSPGYDHNNPYDYHAQASHSPYDQPYADSPGAGFHAMSPPTHAYSPGPQYPVGVAVSPGAEMDRPVPFRQPSPALPYRQPSLSTPQSPAVPGRQRSPSFPYRQNSPGVPFRQPSPGLPLRQASPGIPPIRQPSPGFASATTTQPPSYRAFSPAVPQTPPPPFSAGVPQQISDPGRPPSLLQSGPKPAPNSFG